MAKRKLNYIKLYWKEIESGKIKVSKSVYKVYKKIIKDIDKKGKWRFDIVEATKPIEFIELFCKQSQGKMGEQLKLDLWQKSLIQIIFGFVNKQKVRKYIEVFILVGRKNGKSTLLSAIALYMLIGDKEGAAEIYSVATKLDQAKIIIQQAINMVRQSPDLAEIIKKRRDDIFFPLTASKMLALASDSKTLDGLNTHLGIIDEAHAITDRNLYEVIKQSMQSRDKPLLATITTNGGVRECIYDEMYDYSHNVINGITKDERFLALLYELESKDEVYDESNWIKANPGLGTIKKLDALREDVKRGINNPNYMAGVLTKHFNIPQTSNKAWLSYEEIFNPKTVNYDTVQYIYTMAGVDLSSTTDLTNATQLWLQDNEIHVEQMYWLPADKLEQRIKEDKIPYDKWVEKGFMRLCDGAKIQYSDVTKWFLEQRENKHRYPMFIGFDPWQAPYWVQEMKDENFFLDEVRQGAKTMSMPMKVMQGDLRNKKIVYNNNPILKWCLTNLGIKTDDNGNIRPIKGVSQKARIDGAIGLINAYVVYLKNKEDYENSMKGR